MSLLTWLRNLVREEPKVDTPPYDPSDDPFIQKMITEQRRAEHGARRASELRDEIEQDWRNRSIQSRFMGDRED